MNASDASVPIKNGDTPGKAGSYGYVPFKKPAGKASAPRA